MDRKSIIVLVASVAVLVLWFPLVNKLYPPRPLPPGTNTVSSGTNALAQPTNSPPGAPSAPAAPAAVVSAAPQIAPVVATNAAPEELLTVESASARYTFSSHGGGLKLVELRGYPAAIACGANKNADTNKLASLNTKAPVPAMTLLGGEAVQGDGVFKLAKSGTGVRAEKELPGGLVLVKEFQPSTNFLLAVSVRLENRSAQSLSLPPQELVIGTATPLNAHDNALLMGLYWYNGVKAEHIQETWFANSSFLGCVSGSTQRRTEFLGGQGDVAWAAVHNQFFTMVAIPKERAPHVIARHLNLPAPTAAEVAADPKAVRQPFGFQTAFLYPASTLAPQQVVERKFDIFAGPKEYNNLARLGARFGNNLDLVMDFGGFFGWFAKMLLLSMNGLHGWGLPYGLAIIAITVIIKVLFWPLTNASTKSMKRMQELQPQMNALKEKYKDDPKKMNQKLMEFMRDNKVSPLGGCLPMVLQIPVFFGFYTMLQSAIELRGASFLWACDLSQPDTLFMIPGIDFPFNLLPLLMGGTMLWQATLTPPSPGMDPTQQKIMKYMPLMFMVFLYNFSAGLTLYWTAQNLLTILQMKITKTSAPAAPAAPAPVKSKKK
ncbi:MAG: membrane protein insertase YidC [Verrucomicrobia bacterium]|nr:membrane protein insertase YidC [Verrucomicrobiota bacterium]